MRNIIFTLVLVLLLAVVCIAKVSPSDQITSIPGYGPLLSANYAGYVHLDRTKTSSFYWFVESESNPAADPLVLWLNGGPGCSSLLGLLTENGPYTMRHGGAFVRNEFRWTTNASVLYLESPAGVGFSLDSNPPHIWNDNNTAQASYDFLVHWFEKFPQFRNNRFFLAGESYAGHYVPQLAEQILDGSDAVLRKNMQGYMVGNPCTGNIGCGNADPTLDVFFRYNGFMPLNESIPTASGANYDPYDILVPTCPADQLAKRVRWAHPVVDAYRRRQNSLGDAPAPYGPCADDLVQSWLNRADVKQQIHAAANVSWLECSNTVRYDFNNNGVTDLYQRYFKETNWSLMIYSGTSDSVVNFVQTQTIVNEFKLPLKNPKYTPWNYPYVYNATALQLGGFYLEFDRLSWAGVRDAGHMVPQYNPPEAKELFTSFITTGKPGRH
jgi:serine carboxypeptidase-like clade 2